MYKSGLTVVAHVADSPKQQEIVTFILAILLNVVEPLWVFTVQMCNIMHLYFSHSGLVKLFHGIIKLKTKTCKYHCR